MLYHALRLHCSTLSSRVAQQSKLALCFCLVVRSLWMTITFIMCNYGIASIHVTSWWPYEKTRCGAENPGIMQHDASRWWQLFKRIFYILAVAPPSMWRTVAANDQTQGPNSVISPANVSLSKWTFILPLRHCAVFQTDWENLSVNPTVLPSSLPPQMRRWWRTPIRPVTFPGVRCPVTARPQEAPHPEAPRAPEGSTRPENTMR